MPCIDPTTDLDRSQALNIGLPPANLQIAQIPKNRKVSLLVLGIAAALIYGCASRPLPPHSPAPSPTPAPAPVFTPQPAPAPAPEPASVGAQRLPTVASWADYRRRAAQLIIASNPGASFVGPQPLQWSGIATVTVMVNADGSVRALDLMRGSRISPEVNDLALAAVRRAANYGPVSNLPQPWQFNETFLYNESNKFQLVTIVESR